MRRILIAALIVLGVSSGASAEVEWDIEKSFARDGSAAIKITFAPFTIDTSSYLDGAAATVNDSLIFDSPLFVIPSAWTVAWCKGFYISGYQDTVSTIDTIGYLLQTKCADQSDSNWHRIATCAKADEDQINTLPVSFDMKAFADADSTFMCDAYRLRIAIIAEEAQWRLEAGTANGGDAGMIPFNAKYGFYLYFVDKGNQ